MDKQQRPIVSHVCYVPNVMCQPGWEESLGEKGYMYMYGWVPSWNYHNIVNRLHPNTKLKVDKKKGKKEKCPVFSLDLITQLNVIIAFSHPFLESDFLTSCQVQF